MTFSQVFYSSLLLHSQICSISDTGLFVFLFFSFIPLTKLRYLHILTQEHHALT